MTLLTDEEIRSICPKADNIIITGDDYHKEIGIKVGLFAQATAINLRMEQDNQRHTIRNLYMDLVMMNRRQDEQVRKAQEEANAARG